MTVQTRDPDIVSGQTKYHCDRRRVYSGNTSTRLAVFSGVKSNGLLECVDNMLTSRVIAKIQTAITWAPGVRSRPSSCQTDRLEVYYDNMMKFYYFAPATVPETAKKFAVLSLGGDVFSTKEGFSYLVLWFYDM